MEYGPQVPFCKALHKTKYRQDGETFREFCARLASPLADGSDHYHRLRDILLEQRFLPAGRIQAAVGTGRDVTAMNCFVSGDIADSFVEDPGCIMDRAKEAAATMRMGGGIGYNFSTLRPRGAWIRTLQSRSSGPIGFMGIYDSVCRCTASAGNRRGAQMAVLDISHPDILEFIHCKHDNHSLTGFNISIGVTDKFMEALLADEEFPLMWKDEVYRKIKAKDLWEAVMRSTWDWAEPGVLFMDTINNYNNLRYCETIRATNPCGEQPLPPYGACLLGSFNLIEYVSQKHFAYSIDKNKLHEDIRDVVRAMDKVVDISLFALEEQRKEALNKRRMGLGVTGLANALETMGYPYGTPEFVKAEKEILSGITNVAYQASVEIAREKGAFPYLNREKYIESDFMKYGPLTEEVKEEILRYGIRNSHLTSIAPTGTISLCADNVSSGIEPVFAKTTKRLVQLVDGPSEEVIQDYAYARFGTQPKVSSEVTLAEHLDVLATAQRNIDSSVSKTCIVPPTTSWEDFKDIYTQAWERKCKGITTFTDGGERKGILTVEDEDGDGVEACKFDPDTGTKSCE